MILEWPYCNSNSYFGFPLIIDWWACPKIMAGKLLLALEGRAPDVMFSSRMPSINMLSRSPDIGFAGRDPNIVFAGRSPDIGFTGRDGEYSG